MYICEEQMYMRSKYSMLKELPVALQKKQHVALYLGFHKRTSLKVLFEDEQCLCICVCVRMIWVTSSHLVLALRSQACFLFSPPLPRKLLPPSGIGLWKAGQVSPTRMAWKYTHIHPAVLSLPLKSATESEGREQGCEMQRPFMGQCRRLLTI